MTRHRGLRLVWAPIVAFALAACGGEPTNSLGAPDEGFPSTTREPPPASHSQILVDASHDGGVWWFPQAGEFNADEYHQGQALADYLRSRGFEVEELPRGTRVTDVLLSGYRYVIRAGEFGAYGSDELEAYAKFVKRGVTLILLSDHRKNDPVDELAEQLGVTFAGIVDGTVTRLASHAITEGVTDLPFIAGAAATGFDPEQVEVLGWVADTIPVMGIIHGHQAKIFFLTDTNGIELVPQPFVDNLIAWGFSER